MSDQSNHLFCCEEAFEPCAVSVIIRNDYWSALLPDNRFGSRKHFSKQLVRIRLFNMDVSTANLGGPARLNQILMASNLIADSIKGQKLNKAIHCLGGGTFHDYVHSTAHSVVVDRVGVSTKKVNNLFRQDIVWNLENE